jgi:hypothetical protein
MTKLHFDADKVAPLDTLLPTGWYDALIVSSYDKLTNDTTGYYIALNFQISGCGYDGRKITQRYNIGSPHIETRKLANGGLKALCNALGIQKFMDTEELHGAAVRIYVVTNGNYYNEIRKYQSANTKPVAMPDYTFGVQQVPIPIPQPRDNEFITIGTLKTGGMIRVNFDPKDTEDQKRQKIDRAVALRNYAKTKLGGR